MHYFLRNNNDTAARQLIFIGEQNSVREKLEPAEQKGYALHTDMQLDENILSKDEFAKAQKGKRDYFGDACIAAAESGCL